MVIGCPDDAITDVDGVRDGDIAVVHVVTVEAGISSSDTARSVMLETLPTKIKCKNGEKR